MVKILDGSNRSGGFITEFRENLRSPDGRRSGPLAAALLEVDDGVGGGAARGVVRPAPAAPGAPRTPGWNTAYSSEREPGGHEGHDRVALLRVGRARGRRAESSAVHAQSIATVRRWPWPRRMSRWWRWPASAWCQCWRLTSRRTNENTTSRIGTPRITTGIGEGREEEVRVAREREVGSAADRDRRHREQHAEEQRARVAHDDLRGMPVERQEPDAHADRDDRDERRDVVAAEIAGLEQPVGEQEQRAAGDRDDARRPSRRARR